jgi:hypothetical protein
MNKSRKMASKSILNDRNCGYLTRMKNGIGHQYGALCRETHRSGLPEGDL